MNMGKAQRSSLSKSLSELSTEQDPFYCWYSRLGRQTGKLRDLNTKTKPMEKATRVENVILR